MTVSHGARGEPDERSGYGARVDSLATLGEGVSVHESAYIDRGAVIGAGTCIWHFSHILPDSRVGERCRIGQNVVIGPRVRIGNNVKIQNNVSVYEGVTLEDDVFCGPSIVFTNIDTPRSAFPRNRVEDNLPTHVRRGASIGANATIRCGCTIGEYALVGAGAVVTRDIQPHAVVYGNPARRRGWACVCGIVLDDGPGDVTCVECGRRYDVLVDECVSITADDPRAIAVSPPTIPVCDVRPQDESMRCAIEHAIAEVVAAGHYILGPNVRAFEEEIARFCDCKHAIGVGNGTDALHLALRALRIGPGDEVITTPFTFVATTEAIQMVGAIPIFVDIDPVTYNIDPSRIETAITSRTKVIMPVHLFGHPCEMDAIMAVARRYGLKVVEDCAQSLGATYRGRGVGTFGDVGCLSFFPSKNLGCIGDGGMVITSDPVVFERVEMLRRHGGRVKYHHEELGINSRLDELQAAVLRAKLPHLARWNEDRRRIAAAYDGVLAELDGVEGARQCGAEATHVFHQYTIALDGRDAVGRALNSLGIGTAVYYPTPLHLQPVHAGLGYRRGDFPVSEVAATRVLSLPMYPGLPHEAIERIGRGLRAAIGSSSLGSRRVAA
ncbi:MAG: aminotransferase class I/II-fold pyridoxal phosphate-dependent enzyme [Planctomycetaceae bacterium]